MMILRLNCVEGWWVGGKEFWHFELRKQGREIERLRWVDIQCFIWDKFSRYSIKGGRKRERVMT